VAAKKACPNRPTAEVKEFALDVEVLSRSV
jgi:hypothetical protein